MKAKNRNTILWVVLFCLVFCLGLTLGYFLGLNFGPTGNSAPAGNPNNPGTTPAANSTFGPSPETTTGPEDAPSGIDTPRGQLYYPAKWTENLTVTQEETADAVKISFSARIAGKDYPLFQIVIGADSGFQVGQITDGNGTTYPVHLHMEELPMYEELTEEQQNTLFAMQEDANYLISYLNLA